MNAPSEKQNVRDFYDKIGWKIEADGFYQNARYEDLRPVSAEYIHRCHMRITPYFQKGGRYLLDAGCGPIQYREYLTYSEHFERRICADISITALIEARTRIGEHGLFVVADVANLPFADGSFDGAVSLHTLHHLALDEQKKAWGEIQRTLKSGAIAAIVNGWTESTLMKKWQPLVSFAERIGHYVAILRKKEQRQKNKPKKMTTSKATGTFVKKLDVAWIEENLSDFSPKSNVEIRCWRSVSVRWMRALIHKPYGKLWLKFIFATEEKNPYKYGSIGQYPLIILRKN